MTDREARREELAAALRFWDHPDNEQLLSYGDHLIRTAARERLSQLFPYPPELVRRVMEALRSKWAGILAETYRPEGIEVALEAGAVAVLDALNGTADG